MRGLFAHYVEHPERRCPRDLRATSPSRSTDYIAGMTDRFCARYGYRSPRSPYRWTLSSPSASTWCGGRHRRGDPAHTSSASPARAGSGLCPFHAENTPTFSVNPVEKLFYCFGCHKGGDVFTFVRETEGLDFARGGRVARGPLRASQLEYEETSPAPRRAASARDRLEAAARGRGELLRAATCGRPRPASRRAATWPSAASREEVCRDFRLGLRAGAWDRSRRRRSRRATPRRSSRPRASSTARGNDRFRAAASVPALERARPRARLRRPRDSTTTTRSRRST